MNVYQHFNEIAVIQNLKTAIVSESESISYSNLLIKVNRFSELLLKYISKEETIRIGILGYNEINDVAILLAISKLNYQVLTINPTLKRKEVDLLLKESGVDILIITKKDMKGYADFSIIGNIEDKFIISKTKLIMGSMNENPIYLITASSGSTGKPKPIVFSQETKLLRMRQSQKLYSISQDDVILNASAIYHSLGQRLVFLPLLNGSTLILLKNFSPKKWIEKVTFENVTFTIAVSTHLHALSEVLLSSLINRTSLSKIVSSSAGISKEVKNSLYQSKKFSFCEQYGASEVATVSNCTQNDYLMDNDSVGKICDDVQVTINYSRSENLSYGEIEVKSPYAFSGYMKNGKLTEFKKNSWFSTGDLGNIEFKQLHFFGRTKEVINCGGQNIFPRDIENYLQSNIHVKECSVIGVNDSYFGQIPIAFIVTSNKLLFGKREINSWGLLNIPKFQIPHDYIFLDSLPKLGSGKIDTLTLRSIYSRINHINE